MVLSTCFVPSVDETIFWYTLHVAKQNRAIQPCECRFVARVRYLPILLPDGRQQQLFWTDPGNNIGNSIATAGHQFQFIRLSEFLIVYIDVCVERRGITKRFAWFDSRKNGIKTDQKNTNDDINQNCKFKNSLVCEGLCEASVHLTMFKKKKGNVLQGHLGLFWAMEGSVHWAFGSHMTLGRSCKQKSVLP